MINSKETITGFNYAFSYALLKKLKQLKQDNRIISDGRLTPIGASTMSYLDEQTNFGIWNGCCAGSSVTSDQEVANVSNLIEHAEEFLAIFEKK